MSTAAFAETAPREGDAPKDRVALLRLVLDHVAMAGSLEDAEKAGEVRGRRSGALGLSLAETIAGVLVVRSRALSLLPDGSQERRRAEEAFDRVLVGIRRAYGPQPPRSIAAGTRMSPIAP